MTLKFFIATSFVWKRTFNEKQMTHKTQNVDKIYNN